MRIKGACSSALFLTACSTTPMIVSHEMVGRPAIPSGPAQIVYGIGRSTITVKVEIADLAADAPLSPAVAAATPADQAADVPVSPVPGGGAVPPLKGKNVGAAAVAPAKVSDPAPGDPSALASCKAVRARFRKDWFAYDQSVATIDALKTYVEGIEDKHTTISDDEAVPITKTLRTWASTIATTLPAGIEAVALQPIITETCPNQLKLTMTLGVEADPSHLFLAQLTQRNTSSDDISLKTDPSGLLLSASTIADDQSGTVLINAAHSIGTVVAFAAGVASGGVTGAGQDIVVTGSLIRKPTPSSEIGPLIDKFEKASAALRPQLIEQIFRAIAAASVELPDAIDPVLPSAPQTFVVTDLAAAPVVIGGAVAIGAKCTDPQSASPKARPDPAGSGNLSYDGLVGSTPRPCIIIARSTEQASQPVAPDADAGAAALKATAAAVGSGDLSSMTTITTPDLKDYVLGDQLARTSAMIADSGHLIVISMARTTFVKNTTELTFTGGQLSSVHYVRPSPAAAIAALPGGIIGGFLGGITDGITGRNNSLKAQTDLIAARAALITAKTQYQTAATAAKTEAAATAAAPK